MSRICLGKPLGFAKMKNPLLLKNVFIKVHLNLRNMDNMSTTAIHYFLCRKVWEMYFNLGIMIIPCEDVNPFAPGDFAEKCVLKLVEWFSGHCRAIKS